MILNNENKLIWQLIRVRMYLTSKLQQLVSVQSLLHLAHYNMHVWFIRLGWYRKPSKGIIICFVLILFGDQHWHK